MESLKNLPLLQTGANPCPPEVVNFYINTFGGGAGVDGTFVITDFLGTAVGVTVGQYFKQAADILNARLADATLATLNTIYMRMKYVVDGTYGDPVTGPVIIPAGPGAGTYADADTALQVLIPLASTQITNFSVSNAADTATLNTLWSDICDRVISETNLQYKAGVSAYAPQAGDKFTVMGLVSSLHTYGQDTNQNSSAYFFEQIADVTTLSGQAIIGAMREGRNNTNMDVSRVQHDNTIPIAPTAVPPQAPLLDSQYTVPEARAFNATQLKL